MAYRLLNNSAVTWILVIAGAAMLCACIFPPPGDTVDPDGGAGNNIPIILNATPPEMAFPGPLTLDPTQPATVFLDILELDVNDVLEVRFFRDYSLDAPTPPLGFGTIDAPDPTIEDPTRRVEDFTTAAWCNGLAPTDTALKTLQVMVSDRGFLSEGDPLFQAVPSDAKTSTRGWIIRCQTP